jgi:hypothetical protein
MGQDSPIKRNLVLTEISLCIADAVEYRRAVLARQTAKLIIEHHPDCAMSEDEILAEISKLAVQRGLPVDLSVKASPPLRVG